MTLNSPSISVIIPVFNAEKHIARALESVLKQTYSNLEIIVIIDGSSDRSAEIVQMYANSDERLKIIERTNRGVFYTRIEGIRLATSDYIMFVDADDWIEPGTVKILYDYLMEYSADVVRCVSFYRHRNDISEHKESPLFNDIVYYEKAKFDVIYKLLFTTSKLNSLCTELIKKSLFNGLEYNTFDMSIFTGEDFLLNLYAYNNLNRILFVTDTLYHYWEGNNSITRTTDIEKNKKKIECVCKVCSFLDSMALTSDNESLKKIYHNQVLLRMLNEVKIYFILIISETLKAKIVDCDLESYLGNTLRHEFILKARKELSFGQILCVTTGHKLLLYFIYKGWIKAIIAYVRNLYIPLKKVMYKLKGEFK
jgi:glycosyltransferase involved in cell wall biosynthesis